MATGPAANEAAFSCPGTGSFALSHSLVRRSPRRLLSLSNLRRQHSPGARRECRAHAPRGASVREAGIAIT